MVLTSGAVTVAIGNCPTAMAPERRRFCAAGSIAMEVIPEPGRKVEKRRPSAPGVILVRKPEAVLVVLGMMSGIKALRVGYPELVV